MTSKTVPYEAPVVIDYGSVQELTLGNGETSTPDVQGCIPAGFHSTRPSGITCKGGA